MILLLTPTEKVIRIMENLALKQDSPWPFAPHSSQFYVICITITNFMLHFFFKLKTERFNKCLSLYTAYLTHCTDFTKFLSVVLDFLSPALF